MTHLFSTATSDMSMAAWEGISEGQICMEAQGMAYFKQELEKACSEVPCNQEMLTQLRSFFARVQMGGNKISRQSVP